VDRSDIASFANEFFRPACRTIRLGNRGPVRQFDLYVELVAVDAGKELRLERWESAKANHRKYQGAENRQLRKAERQIERTVEGTPKPAAAYPANEHRQHFTLFGRRQEPARQCRGNRQCQNKRRKKHDDNRCRNSADKVAGRPRQQCHRRECQCRCYGRSKEWNSKPSYGVAYGITPGFAFFETFSDLVRHHNAGVDQETERHNEPGYGHLMNRNAKRLQTG